MGLFSARDKPRGTFARPRRDWSVENLQVASSTGGGLATDTWTMTLLNNDQSGRYLALYGIWVNNKNETGFDLLTQNGIDSSFGPAIPGVQTKLDQPQGPGLWAAGLNTSFPFTADIFFPTGALPFELVTDSPLFLIPMGYAISLQSFNLVNSADMVMMWAPY